MNSYSSRDSRDIKRKNGIIDSWHLLEMKYKIRQDNYKKVYIYKIEFYNNVPFTYNELKYLCKSGFELNFRHDPVEDISDIEIVSTNIIQNKYF